MKMRFGYVWAFFLLSSCTLRQEYTFTEGFAGSYKLEIDMSSMQSFMGEETKLLDSLNTDSLIDVMNKEEGISESFILEKEGVASMGYNFNGLENLNRFQSNNDLAEAMAGQVEMKKSTEPMFVLKGKKLIYNPPTPDESLMEGGEMEEIEGMEGMMGMLQYEVSMTFAKPVRKINNEDWVISNAGKTVSFAVTVEEWLAGKNGAAIFKF